MMRSKERGYGEIQKGDSSFECEDQILINDSSDPHERKRSHTHFMKRHLTLSNLLIMLLLVLVGVLLNIVIGNTNSLEKQPNIAKVSENQISKEQRRSI